MNWKKPVAVAAVALFATFAFTACGDDPRVKELETKNATLTKENGSLRSQVQTLTSNLSSVTQERDDLKAAASRPPPPPPPAPVAAKAAKKKKR